MIRIGVLNDHSPRKAEMQKNNHGQMMVIPPQLNDLWLKQQSFRESMKDFKWNYLLELENNSKDNKDMDHNDGTDEEACDDESVDEQSNGNATILLVFTQYKLQPWLPPCQGQNGSCGGGGSGSGSGSGSGGGDGNGDGDGELDGNGNRNGNGDRGNNDGKYGNNGVDGANDDDDNNAVAMAAATQLVAYHS